MPLTHRLEDLRATLDLSLEVVLLVQHEERRSQVGDLGPHRLVELSILVSPMHDGGRARGYWATELVPIRVPPRCIAGLVVVGHTVPVAGAGHHGVETSRLEEAIDLEGVADDVVLRLAGPFGFSLHAHRLILGAEKVDAPYPSEGVEDRRDRKVCDHLLDRVEDLHVEGSWVWARIRHG